MATATVELMPGSAPQNGLLFIRLLGRQAAIGAS
jgi:hypothetical protein